MTTFTLNGSTHTANLTEKGKQYEAFHVTAKRWFQKTYGNTYHTVELSGVIGGKWVVIGSSDVVYGGGDHYFHTAGLLLIEQGLLDVSATGHNAGYALCNFTVRDALSVADSVADVKRKKDL